jgi:hypothetical protein
MCYIAGSFRVGRPGSRREFCVMAHLVVTQRPLEETRTPNRACVWVARTEVEGRVFEARSRHGAPNELFRQLVEAGIADAAAEVRSSGLRGEMRYASFHAAAQFTYSEGDAPLRRVRYRDPQDAFAGVQQARKRAISVFPAPETIPASTSEKIGVARGDDKLAKQRRKSAEEPIARAAVDEARGSGP